MFEVVSSPVGTILLDPINLLFGSTENARLFLLPLISGKSYCFSFAFYFYLLFLIKRLDL